MQLQPAFLIAEGTGKAGLRRPVLVGWCAWGKKVCFLHCVIIYDIKQGAHGFQNSRTPTSKFQPPESWSEFHAGDSQILGATELTELMELYRTVIRPIVTYTSETWVLKETVIQKLLVFERKILRRIFGPTKEKYGE